MREEKWQHVLTLRESGNNDAAIEQLRRLLTEYSNFSSGWIELGTLLREKGDRRQSKTCFQKAYELDSTQIETTIYLTQDLITLQHFDEAESYLQAAVDQCPDNIELLVQWGKLERHRGNRAEAIRWFRKIEHVTDQPEQHRDAQIYIVEELRELGQLDEALGLITGTLEQWPNHLRSRMVYGTVLHRCKEWGAAVDVYQTILHEHPNYAHARIWLLKAIPHLGNTQADLDRIEAFKAWLESDRHSLAQSNPEDYCKHRIQVCLQLGDRYRKQHQRQKAYHAYQQALELDPNHLWASLNVAIELRDTGKFDEAEAILAKTVITYPNHFNVLMQLGQLERSRQNVDKAVHYLEQAQQVKPEHLEPTFKIVEALRDAGQWDRARDRLQHLISHQDQYAPNDRAKIDIQRGLLERRYGTHEAALQWFRSAQSTVTDQGSSAISDKREQDALVFQAQWLVIEELRDLGEFEQAKLAIEHSSPQIKSHIRTQLLLGSILQQTLELEQALGIYLSILEAHPDHVVARTERARILGQTGRSQEAIAILQETHAVLGPQLGVLLLLGHLYKALDDQEAAQYWFEMAYRHCGTNPLAHCTFANALFQQGEVEWAFQLLAEGQGAFPQSIDIPFRLASLAQQFGQPELAKTGLLQSSAYGQSIPLQLQYCRLLIRCGDFGQAIASLDKIDTDQYTWRKQVEQLRGELAIQQYAFKAAAVHYQKAIAFHPPSAYERSQLARILLLEGYIEDAHHQLELATADLEKKRSPGQIGLPIKNHVATVINEFRMNPPMMAQLQEAQEEEGRDRLLALGSLLVQEPTFLGTSIYLIKELRVQGIWAQLQQTLLSKNSNTALIPKRIVQFWDDPQPPEDVCRLGQSWVDHNPDYEYKRFSLGEAIAFLERHYDDDVLQAFRLCSHAATQADFFRLAYLNKMGGFYADADDRCLDSLEGWRTSTAELILFQEDFACLGNNFLGCVPGQSMIKAALYQAVDNLLSYSAEWAWSQTGPGLLTSVVCSGLLPYLAFGDYRMWPRLWVMTRGDLTACVWNHVRLAYKGTEKSWQSHAYPKTKISLMPT